jgi:hypothetical protein
MKSIEHLNGFEREFSSRQIPSEIWRWTGKGKQHDGLQLIAHQRKRYLGHHWITMSRRQMKSAH